MQRSITKRMHAAAGALALLLIALFFSATVVTELSGDLARVAAVKRLIAYGVLALIPLTAVAGISGARLSGRSQTRLVRAKRRRTAFVALNGLFVLAPSAFVLHLWAAQGAFGPAFFWVQGLELLAGATNLALMTLNVRDGLRLSGRLRRA